MENERMESARSTHLNTAGTWTHVLLVMLAGAHVGAFGLVDPAGAQVTDRLQRQIDRYTAQYTPEEFVQALMLQSQDVRSTIRYSAGTAFMACPQQSPWHNRVFEIMSTMDLGSERDAFGRSLARARNRCDDPRLDRWLLENLRDSSLPGRPGSVSLWSTALTNYPTEVLREPEFEAFFLDRMMDEEQTPWVRDQAFRAHVRGRPFDDRVQLLYLLWDSARIPRAAVFEMAALVVEDPDRFVRGVADRLRAAPPWEAIFGWIAYPLNPTLGIEVSPAAMSYLRTAIVDVSRDPPSHWPWYAVPFLEAVLDRMP